MSGLPVTLLGEGRLTPAPPTPAADDPDFRLSPDDPAGSRIVRTLSGQLDRAPAGMSRWPRLDRYGRALARVVDRALASSSQQPAGPISGLYVASQHGCFETNAAFHRGLVDKGPRLASPLLFPYTLPGAAASEAAMHFRLLGPYLVFAGGPATALAALLAAADALTETGRGRLVVATSDALGPQLLAALESSSAPTAVPAEAAAALWLGAAGTGDIGRLVTIEGALGPTGPDADAWCELVSEALGRAGVPPRDLRRALSATADSDPRPTAALALERIAAGTPLVRLAGLMGDAGASLGLLAALAAIEEPGPALVLADDRAGSVALVLAAESAR